MTVLGDMTPEDAMDTSDPDPGAVARIYFRALRDITQDPTIGLYDELTELQKWVIALAFSRVLDKIKRERVNG